MIARLCAAALALPLMFTSAIADTTPEKADTATDCFMVAAYKLAKMGAGISAKVMVLYEGRTPARTDIGTVEMNALEESGVPIAYYRGFVLANYAPETAAEYLAQADKKIATTSYEFTCATGNNLPIVPYFEMWEVEN